MRQARSRKPTDGIKLRGFTRLALCNAETGAVEYESPWAENVITDQGFIVICDRIASQANGSRFPGYMEVATQSTAPTSTQDDPLGPFTLRKSVNKATSGNGTVQYTASWNSTEATASNIGALAMYLTDSGGSALSIATLSATVSKSNTQTMNATYNWVFS